MSNKKTIFKILGHIFLGLFVLSTFGVLFFLTFFMSIDLCKGWDCIIYLIYSPFIFSTSALLFYILSRVSDGNIKEKLSETENNKVLIKRLFLGIGLIVLGFIFNSIQLDGPDWITILIGLFFILASIIQLITNYFKNKKPVD